MRERKRLALVAVFVLAACALTASAGSAGAAGGRQIPISGTGSAQTGAFTPSGPGDVTDEEFAGEGDGETGPAAYQGTISMSNGGGRGASVDNASKAKSNPQFQTGFEGLNHYQQRYSRGGNQFSVEPPDQGLCVGNGYVFEAVNDVVNVYNEAGQSVLPDNTSTNIVSGFPRNVNHAVDLNSFYGYAPAINRTTGVRGPFVTDPSCLYDAATQRFFVVVLTLETYTWRRFHDREPPRHRGEPDVEPDRRVEYLQARRHERRDEHRWNESGPVPRRLSAYRRGRQRLLHHHQRVSVVLQRLLRRTDLRPLRRRSSPPARPV